MIRARLRGAPGDKTGQNYETLIPKERGCEGGESYLRGDDVDLQFLINNKGLKKSLQTVFNNSDVLNAKHRQSYTNQEEKVVEVCNATCT